jgi:PDZ domain-containing secreted protein
MRSSESDAFAPKQEVDCASPTGGKTSSHAVNNYDVESDPFAKDCEPVSGDRVDGKLDEIFSSSKEFYMEKTVPGPSVTMSRKAKKQQQKETQLRLQQQREDERLRKQLDRTTRR